MKNELKHTNEHMVQGIPPLTLCPGASSHMRTREHRNHRLFPAVPSAREPPALPDCAGCARSAWTAQPTLNGRSGRAARASSLKEAGPKVRAATHAWGRSQRCAEGTNEKAGKDGMERQGVRCTYFLRAGGGLTGRERQRSWASPTNPRPAACLLPYRPLLARLGPDFLTDLPGSD